MNAKQLKLNHKKKKHVRERPKTTLGKLWYFIWHDDSLASWLVNIVLAFVLIKFIIYPLLGLAFGTSFPIVAVVSPSMEHRGGFESWWNNPARCPMPCTQREWYYQNNITLTQFKNFPFSSGFKKGDIMVLFGVEPENVKIGDVIVFKSGQPYPIIHRVYNIKHEERIYFQTKGDNNEEPINSPEKGLNEYAVSETQLIGRAVFRVPWLGYIKIWFVEFIWGPLTSVFAATT